MFSVRREIIQYFIFKSLYFKSIFIKIVIEVNTITENTSLWTSSRFYDIHTHKTCVTFRSDVLGVSWIKQIIRDAVMPITFAVSKKDDYFLVNHSFPNDSAPDGILIIMV